ncbi:hypothetical protein AB0D12_31945 [Streptomyces sp. NPDC048479]|uniref:hypothetical protein n=1 Tax=Streptomyces sp. NPDC048479 TaxID=3154725 RepID=UPI00344A4602
MLRKHAEAIALFIALTLFGSPFIAFWIVIVDPHRPSPLATIAVCCAVSVVMVLVAQPVEREIQRRQARRERRKARTAATPTDTPAGGTS